MEQGDEANDGRDQGRNPVSMPGSVPKMPKTYPVGEFFEQQPGTIADLWARLIELRRTGAVQDPPVQLYPFTDARDALRAIAHRQARGKVVLSRQF